MTSVIYFIEISNGVSFECFFFVVAQNEENAERTGKHAYHVMQLNESPNMKLSRTWNFIFIHKTHDSLPPNFV